MTNLEGALRELSSFMDEHRIPYMIIGGFANLHWGLERFTKDLDLTIEVEDEGVEPLIDRLATRFRLDRTDAILFARRNHLIRLHTSAGVPVDLMIAVLPYEIGAIRRAHDIRLSDHAVRMCAPEDLIIYKLASERLQDAADVEGIVLKQSKRLDRRYLAMRVQELATGLERPGIVEFYNQLLERADAIPD